MQYDMITLRELVGKVLVEYGEKNPDICVIDSDLAKSTTTNRFQEAFPERFYELGIAEQNAMSVSYTHLPSRPAECSIVWWVIESARFSGRR